MTTGTLYGIGVGPGAPDLLTLRAAATLGKVDVILAAASPRNDYSTALETARPHLNPHAEIVRLEFPMTHNAALLTTAWNVAADTTEAILRQGRSAAFITIGDPLVYSTFGYLSRTLQARWPDLPLEIISGITSFQAAAARTNTILCEGKESLLILPGINGGASLKQGLEFSDNTVILKAYKNFPAIREALEQAHCLKNATFASRVYLNDEMFTRDLSALPAVPPYLSLVLAKKE
ncbi:MAG: precorrin-2 C(20)-methyltransferase [Desulfovibrionaceae bacterium]